MATNQDQTLPLFAREESPLLLLMDGHAMVHRSFRAISVQRHLSISGTGEDTTGVYGFTNVFLRALQDWKPTYCAIAFDMSGPTFRHERFEEYKAQRPSMPPELRPQFDRVRQLMTGFGVPIFQMEGYEADDIIGTLARQAEAHRVDTVIITGDRDTFQLISPKTRVDLFYSIQDRTTYDEPELEKRYSGLTAAQQPDFKALVGDSSDNIPGVPRVGEKRAIGLLTDFHDLEGIYEHIEEVKPPSVKTSLAENRDRAFENRWLMTINRESPVVLDLEGSRFGSYDRKSVVDLLSELEFFSVIGRLPGPTGGEDEAWGQAPKGPVAADTDYEAVRTSDQLEAMIAAIEEAGSFAFDTETTSLDPVRADLVGLSFATAPGKAWYVPVGHQDGPQLPLESVLPRVRPLLESTDINKCAHNANFDATVLASHGIECRNLDFDTMIAGHLLGKSGQGLGLKNMSLDVLGVEMTPITQLIGTGRKKVTFDKVDIEQATAYAAADADITGRLRGSFEGQLSNNGFTDLLNEVEMPLVPVLVNMQRNGVKVEGGALHEMSRDLNDQMNEVQQQIFQSIGHSVNINSPKALSDVLFNELGLPRTKRTKTGYSTDANALEGLRGLHPVVDGILEYRQVSKLKSTYVDSLPEMINPDTGRIHTKYNQTGSATGRVSSSDPNLQNIPVRTELGRNVRRAFVADGAPDWVLFSADYSQIELRVLAHLSQDPDLLEAFQRGEDIHSSTGSLMFEVPINEVNSDMRRIAKVLNFGVIYGLSPHGISQQTGFSREEGAKFIESYFSNYPGVSQYIENVKEQAHANEFVETVSRRRRYLPDINASNFNVRGAAERMAINMPIQGTAADIMKLAMIRVHDRLKKENLRSKMLLQVHDELVFEVPQDELDAIQQLVFDEMPAALELDVTLKVDTKWATNWGDME